MRYGNKRISTGAIVVVWLILVILIGSVVTLAVHLGVITLPTIEQSEPPKKEKRHERR